MIFPYAKQANTKMQVHKYTNTEHTTKGQKKTCGIFQKQLYNSSNIINAESAQFTRSSLVVLFCVPVKCHPVCGGFFCGGTLTGERRRPPADDHSYGDFLRNQAITIPPIPSRRIRQSV